MNITGFKSALQTRLQNVTGLFGTRIFVDRERPLEDADLPCAVIRFKGAEASRTLIHEITWQAQVDVELVVKAAETTRPDTTAEGYLNIVLARLYTNMKLNDVLADEMSFTGVRPEESAEGERVVRKLILSITGELVDGVYDVAADAFETAHIDIDMASPRNDPQTPAEPDGQLDAAAIITLPQ